MWIVSLLELFTVVNAMFVTGVSLYYHRPFSCWMWPVITIAWVLHAHTMRKLWQKAIDN
jgi:hypothetical protein